MSEPASPPAPPGELLRRLFARALARVEPTRPTAAALAELDLADSVLLLATGKAALGMAAGAETALGRKIRERIVVVPAGCAGPARPGTREGAHPVPDARSEEAGRALLSAASRARPDEDVIVLVSGGGSALTAVPAAGLTLADKAEAVARLMAAGAPIGDLNCVRRHLSALKGGRLARASAARVTTLVVSDVVGDALAQVASGPTVPDPTSFADACAVVERWIGWDAVPPPVRRHLESGRRGLRPEGLAAPRHGDRAILLFGLGALVEAAAEEARSAADDLAVPVEVLQARLEGPVETVAEMLAGRLVAPPPRRGCLLVAGGEPTVVLSPNPGRSGRAHHLALVLARRLDGSGAGGEGVTILAAGSDGVDGTSEAAGAVIDSTTWGQIRAAGLDPQSHLATCDAATALAAVGAQIVTGPTGVNHADLVLAYCAPKQAR